MIIQILRLFAQNECPESLKKTVKMRRIPKLVTARTFRSTCSITGLAVAVLLELGGAAEGALPILIRQQPDSVQRAWVEIDRIISENQKLSQPLPDPYMARGDLWSRAGSQEDALSDYLKATELFFLGSPTPSEQARHLAQLRQALTAVVQQPKPRYPNEAKSEYALGLIACRKMDYASAENHFTEASRLMPEDAIFRVHRAIALLKLDREDEARRQVSVALSLIRAKGRGVSDEIDAIHVSLEHVQGPPRIWISRELELTSSTSSKTDR